MYASFFKLNQVPFGLTPDTSFYLNLPQHEAALEVLRTALASGEGFIKVTGEVGTGKTLICRMLLNQAPADWQIAYLPDPVVSPMGLRAAVAYELGLALPEHIDANQLQQKLQAHLVALAAADKRVILVIDEAQALPDETLEALRLLTNLETEKQKLLQVVLFGQPELNQRLSQQHLRQLKQRITFSQHISGMTREQIAQYVRYRTTVAGCERPLFNHQAIKLLHAYSKGTPRLVNILAHKALMLAYGEGKYEVNGQHMYHAAADTESIEPGLMHKMLLGINYFWGSK